MVAIIIAAAPSTTLPVHQQYRRWCVAGVARVQRPMTRMRMRSVACGTVGVDQYVNMLQQWRCSTKNTFYELFGPTLVTEIRCVSANMLTRLAGLIQLMIDAGLSNGVLVLV